MKKLTTILVLLITFSSFSQTNIKKSSIDSGGTISSNGNIELIYSIGEVVVQETTLGNIYISEGFINKNMTASLDLESYTNLEGVTVFPNPTIDYINIHFSDRANYNISIFDYAGKQLEQINTNQSSKLSIDMTTYNKGIYLVLLKDASTQQFKSYRIIKK